MKQLSLVSFYGPKESLFAELIAHCQSAVAESPLGRSFEPYGAGQVHATITGMESLPGKPRRNKNRWSKHGIASPMDFSNLVEILEMRLPMSIRVGGFEPDDTRVSSQGKKPYERSFQVHRASGKVTLVGWPHLGGEFGGRMLEALRRDLAESCHIEHRYDGDNDFYLVLGTVRPAMAAESTSAVEETVRNHLARRPLDIELEVADVVVVRYEEENLDPTSTLTYPVTDPSLTPDRLEALYDS